MKWRPAVCDGVLTGAVLTGAELCCAWRCLCFQADTVLQTGRARALMGDWDGAFAALEQVGPKKHEPTSYIPVYIGSLGWSHQPRMRTGGGCPAVCPVFTFVLA